MMQCSRLKLCPSTANHRAVPDDNTVLSFGHWYAVSWTRRVESLPPLSFSFPRRSIWQEQLLRRW